VARKGAHPFELALAQTEYRVIPIEQQPVRLAIDLKNAQSKKMPVTWEERQGHSRRQ
jgi:hypothetical protein